MIPYFSNTQGKALEERVSKLEQGAGGKVWKELRITPELIQSLQHTGTADYQLEEPYDPSNFENDYVKAVMDIQGERIGNLVSAIEPLHRLYVDFVHVDDWCNASVQSEFIEASNSYGFEHQNYKMGIIYAKSDNVDFVAINTNKLDTIEDDYSEAGIAYNVTTMSAITGWTSADETPLTYELNEGEIRVGHKDDESQTYIICYRSFADSKYYYTAQTTGASTVYVRGSNLGWDGGLIPETYSDFVLEREIANEPVMENSNPMNAYNIVYIADVTRQPWDQTESNPGVEPGSSEQETTLVGKQYAISIHGKDTKVSYLMVFEEGEMSVINPESHEVASWNTVEAGSVYHLTWDATANRFSLGQELTTAEKEALYNTGIEFDSNGGALAVAMIVDEVEVWRGRVVGSESLALQYVFSADEEFAEPTETQKGTFIARPLGFEINSYTSFDDETQTYVTHKQGEYAWGCEVGSIGSLIIYVPLPEEEGEEMDVCSIRLATTGRQQEYNSLYRHTFKIQGTSDLGNVAVTMTAVNCQQANSSTTADIMEYLINSDTSAGWLLPANGVLYVGSTRYDIISLTNISGDPTPVIGGTTLYADCVDSTCTVTRKAIAAIGGLDEISATDVCVYLGSILE